MTKQITQEITTKNINDAIGEFATKNSIKQSLCDFKINNINSYIKSSSQTEFELSNQSIKTRYTDKNQIINEHIEFSQYYDITIFEINKHKIKLNYKIELGEYSSHPKIILSPDSNIPYQNYQPKELLSLLFREINKIKASNSIIVGLFDESMIKNLKALVKYIYAKKFIKNIKLPLFDGILPELTQESKLVIKFLQKENNYQIIEVEKDEILIDFYKPQFGKNGLNCYGKEIGTEYANNQEDLKQEIDLNSIKIIEVKNKKSYISKIKGFVQYSDTNISVDQKIKMARLSRIQDSIASEETNNIEIEVSQKDTNKDSVGEGVKLVSETINVSGHIGANSIIESINLKIDGATHKDSTQYAKYATINRHKGKLRCKEAKINLLEGGEVHATSANIQTCLGGSIYAQDVKIRHVKNNLKVYASNSISINLISGEDNKLKINYKDVPILISKIKFIKEEIEELEFSLEEANRHNSSIVNGIKSEIKKLKQEILDIQNSVNRAKISIEKPLIGLNTIIFSIDDENEITFKTNSKEYTPFYLEITEDKITLHPTNQIIKLQE